MAVTQRSGGYLERPRPSGLADVIDVILDKGLVIDAYLRVSLVGIELLAVDARIVIASVDTYLRFADAVNRLGHRRRRQLHRTAGSHASACMRVARRAQQKARSRAHSRLSDG